MIIQIRILPTHIEKNEVLLRRIKISHEKYEKIQENLRKLLAGYRGEVNLDYHLNFLPEKKYLIFQGLSLKTKDFTFQIDALVVSAHSITMIESKNFQGQLFFDPHSKQMLRSMHNEEEGFSNPLAQVKRHKLLFQRWLDENKLPSCPIEHLVSISNPSTIIKSDPMIFHRVLHAEHIPEKIQELEKNYLKPSLTSFQLQKLSERLVDQNTPNYFDVLEHYQISSKDIVPGVCCPHCNHLPLTRVHGSWLCPACFQKSSQAHRQAIEDYLMLYSTITNREC